MSFDETLKQVGETVLPGITEVQKHHQKALPTNKSAKLGNEIVSDLSLQMSLFFNVCYFPAWLVMSVAMTILKYDSLNYLYKFILVTVLVAVTVIEAVRLYLGYLGNLTERVSLQFFKDLFVMVKGLLLDNHCYRSQSWLAFGC